MINELDVFSDSLGRIYEAGLDPDCWPLALESISEILSASKAQMLYVDPKEYFFSFACGYGFDPYDHNIGAGRFRAYLAEDPVAQYGLNHLNEVFSDSRVVDQKKMRESPMQQEIRDPANMQHLLTAFITDEDKDWTGICFFRGKEALAFTPDDEEKLRRFVPHIRRSTSIHKTVSGLSNFNTIQNAILDNLKEGIILVDDQHHIVLCNREAKRIIGSTDALKISNSRITCKYSRENTLFQLSIDGALNPQATSENELKSAIKICGSSDNPSLLAVITKLQLHKFEEKLQNQPISAKHYTAKLPHKKHVIITLCDPGDYRNSSAEILEKLFELTPAEAALAERLSLGECLKDAASLLGRKTGTARLQLQSIFEKTNTNRQASLIKLIMSIP